MTPRLLLFLNRASFEPAYQATSVALTAAAMGAEVSIVLGFEPLHALSRGEFGEPSCERERVEQERGRALGAQSPGRMLDEARALGVRTVACDTMVKLCGLRADELAAKVSHVEGLPSIWRLADGAQVLSF